MNKPIEVPRAILERAFKVLDEEYTSVRAENATYKDEKNALRAHLIDMRIEFNERIDDLLSNFN
jgi:hypothetical protein